MIQAAMAAPPPVEGMAAAPLPPPPVDILEVVEPTAQMKAEVSLHLWQVEFGAGGGDFLVIRLSFERPREGIRWNLL